MLSSALFAAGSAILVLSTSALASNGLKVSAPRRILNNVVGDPTGLKINVPVGKQGCTQPFCDITGEYIHSDALFGVPAYGADKTITGQIYYVTP